MSFRKKICELGKCSETLQEHYAKSQGITTMILQDRNSHESYSDDIPWVGS